MSSAFDFTREQDGFEAVNTYYHVDHVMKYLNETLGLGIFPTLNGGEVIFDPHGLSGADNSHYVSSTELIAFGEGGVDDAEDADVIIHELGHGLHDWAAGCISQSNGLSEGIGDYAAVEYSRTLGQWTPADPEYDWVFSWDGHNPFWSGRVTDWNDTHTWPDGTGGGCLHTCGQYWSSSMIDIYEQLGRDATARAHWTGVMSLGCSATHVDAANAVLQAAVDLGYSAADVNTIYDVFANNTGYPVDPPPQPPTRYVAPTGNDIGDCTDPLNPCATLTYAVDQAKPGDIIDLAAGTYTEPGLVIEKNVLIQGAGVVVQ
jgi:hypothetical protein